MFTGIIEELGEVTAWVPTSDAARLTVRAPIAVSDAKHGDSILSAASASPSSIRDPIGSPRM
ncbi:MAG: riboflavin synthase [Glaciihabitans sp.]|nr:riboflavin synthase [Glaciihabitans sp.]